MGLFDNLGDLARQHEEQIEAAIEQVGDAVDEKTGGKYAGHVDQAQAVANEQLDRLAEPQEPPAER